MRSDELKPQLPTLFPIQFRNASVMIEPESYLELVKDYINNLPNCTHIIHQSDLAFIAKNKLLIKEYRFIFYQDYASIVVLSRKKTFMPTNLGILFFKRLNSNAFTNKQASVYFNEEPEDIGYYEVQELEINGEGIDEEYSKIKHLIQQNISNLSSQNRKQKSPFALREIVKEALSRSQQNNFLIKQDTNNHQSLHFPQVKHQFCYLIYSFVFANSNLVKVLLLSFKINHLYIYLKTYQLSIELIEIVKNCLQDVIVKYKILYNRGIDLNNQLAFPIFNSINKIIQDQYLKNDVLNLQLSENSLIDSLKTQQRFEKPQNTKNIIDFCDFDQKQVKSDGKIGWVQHLTFNTDTPFTELDDLYRTLKNLQNGQYYWVWLVQKCFFYLSGRLKSPKISHYQTCTDNREGISIMHKVLICYQMIMVGNKNSEYNLLIKNQAYSHLYLIKNIAAIIAYELYKQVLIKRLEEKKLEFDIKNYKIEIDAKELYNHFTSLSFEARNSLENVATYVDQNKSKTILFSLNQNQQQNIGLKQLAEVFAECPQHSAYLQSKRKSLQNKIKQLNNYFNLYREKYNNIISTINTLTDEQCTCTFYTDKFNVRILIQCSRCISLNYARSNLQKVKKQTFSNILAEIPKQEDDQNLFAFFQNEINQTLGPMKIIYQSQIPIQQKQQFSLKSNILPILLPLTAYSWKKEKSKLNYYENVILKKLNASKFVVYQDPITIYFHSYNKIMPINTSYLRPQQNKKFRSLQWLIDESSTKNKDRQHMIYANLDKKETSNIQDLKFLSMEQFKDYASIRVCFRTELIILAQGILSRQIAPIVQKPHQFQRLIIMNACGNIKSFKAFKKNSKNYYVLQQRQLTIIRQSIEELLTNYLQNWKFDDLHSLQIIGVVLSLLSKLLDIPYLAVKIASRAFKQYQTVKEQNANSGRVELRLKELYFLHSIMSCFSQDICKNNGEGCIVFAKIMVNYRLNKRFIKNQNSVNKQYVAIIDKYKYYFNRALINNIHSVVNYFDGESSELNAVVKQVDKDISNKYKWQLCRDSNYVFETADYMGNVYQINLFEGIVLKNGSETSTLSKEIKQDKNFIQIFGRYADLQVFQQKNRFYQTRSDFSHYFGQQKNTGVFFEFCVANHSQVKIKMIFKKEDNTKQSFLLVPHSVLEQDALYFPQLYLKHYQCWINVKSKHLVFRKRTLETMNNVGIIYMSKIGESQLYGGEDQTIFEVNLIHQARIINKQSRNLPVGQLTSQNNFDQFQQLVITDKLHFYNKAIQVLSSIENPKYILQIYSSAKNKKIIFWLHRCDLKFTFDQKLGLVSENFQGYSVPNDYRHHELLPWRRKDAVQCLILKKYQNTLRTANLHEFMLLLPNQTVQKNGKINIVEGDNPSNILCYEIHDNFMDIRSKSRLNQIHLICLIASLNSGLPFKPLMVTNEEYCVSLIRSCYNNSQLDNHQCQKMINLLNICVEKNLNTLILCCDVLIKLSGSLRDILAYKQCSPVYQENLTPQLKKLKDLIKACKIIYRKRFEEGLTSPNRKLNNLQLTFLGINQKSLREVKEKQKLNKWFINQRYSPKFDDKITNGFQNMSKSYKTSQQAVDNLKSILMSYFQKEEQSNPENQYIPKLYPNDILAKQMNEDMQSSCMSYLRQSQKRQQIQSSQAESQIKKIANFKKKFTIVTKSLQKYLNQIHSKANENLDVIVGYTPVIKPKSYTEILCNPQLIYEYYPNISIERSQIIIKAIREWILLTLQIQSLSRIQLIFSEKTIDKVALFRELQSPRKEINEKDYWICFEAQMKIRIWLSQYDTYKHLRQSRSGSVSQLNMGEGKTQVIIPMIVLDNIYDKSRGNPVSRINILSQLFQQAQGNYFRFFSVTSFRIPIFSLYFNRDVKLTKQNIHRIKFFIYLLRDKMLMLLDRQSCLSMVLKIREDYLNGNSFISDIGQRRDDWLFDDNSVYDIFDEVDALMTCRKSFVYSIGPSSDLADSRLRFEFARLFLEIVCVEMFEWLLKQKMAVIEETYEKALESVKKGGFPKGFRLKKNLNHKQLNDFRHRIVDIFLNNQLYRPPQFEFYQNLNEVSKKILMKFVTDQSDDSLKYLSSDLPKDTNQILAVRGLIAFRILQHCLTMRNGVDFGVPGEEHPKKIGVPYEAADVPSKRSEFSHPDVAIVVSYLSYFSKGITHEQFNDYLLFLTKKPQSVKHYNYDLWLNIIQDKQFAPNVQSFNQINIQSETQIKQLYERYKFNRNTIVFWLINKIFERDLRQYASTITSSCWDISYVNKSIGFSGTKDTRWLFPNYLQWAPSHNDTINGTDGKMVHQMLRSTKGILVIKEGKESLWERFCQNVLDLKDEEIGCIIDAGAILVGKSFEKEIIPWIVKNPRFNKYKFKGITFCDENGKWKVYDTVTLSVVQRGTSIPEHDTFVIFDEARTRGADIKMATNVRAVVSLSPTMTKDKLMQAVGRLRKFGRNQQIYIMGTAEVFQRIEGFEERMALKEKVERVIEWACENSINENRNMQYPNSRLAQIHYKTILEGKPDVQQFDSSLKSLYSGTITEKSVYEIYQQSISVKFSESILQSKQIIRLSQKMKEYGEEHQIKTGQFQDACQREVEYETQIQIIQQIKYEQLVPIQESDKLQIFDGHITEAPLEFDNKLKFSQNFIQCTKTKNNKLFINQKEQDNQLSNINFFLWQGELVIITQREMARELDAGTTNFGYQSLLQHEHLQLRFVGKFKDLSLQIPFVNGHQVFNAVVHAQFFNGNEFYKIEGRKILFDLVKQYMKKNNFGNRIQLDLSSISSISQQERNIKQRKKDLSLQNIVAYFLNRRKTFHSKFINSDLEKVLMQLKSISTRSLYS